MRRARYEGIGEFPDERWGRDLSWSCDAYWPDEEAQSPTVLVVSINAVLGAKLHDACLYRFEGLPGSRSSFTTEDWVNGTGFDRGSARIKMTLRHEGFDGDQLALSGTWYQKIRQGQAARNLTLQGSLVETGIGHPSSLKAGGIPEAKCNVQHIAHRLEELLKKLSDGKSLADVEAGELQMLIDEYWNGDCGSQSCRPGNCAFRRPHDWLQVPHRYKDIADVLSYEKSGISDNPPRLRARHGVETLRVPVRRPGHYNP